MPKDDIKCADGSITVISHDGADKTHWLWATPVVISKPFDEQFMQQLKKDVAELLPIASKNSVDVWSLPNLPDTMKAVMDKKVELANQVFNEDTEMPLPKLRIAKGYFRHIHENMAYRITPHHHGSTLGAGIFYISLNNENPGYLVLVDPRGGVNYTNQFSCFKRIKLEEGMMIITPGYLIHFVEPTDYSKPVYQERLMIVSNIHRMYEDWIEVLKKNDEYITTMGGKEL
jgi:hypothetical protein